MPTQFCTVSMQSQGILFVITVFSGCFYHKPRNNTQTNLIPMSLAKMDSTQLVDGSGTHFLWSVFLVPIANIYLLSQ